MPADICTDLRVHVDKCTGMPCAQICMPGVQLPSINTKKTKKSSFEGRHGPPAQSHGGVVFFLRPAATQTFIVPLPRKKK